MQETAKLTQTNKQKRRKAVKALKNGHWKRDKNDYLAQKWNYFKCHILFALTLSLFRLVSPSSIKFHIVRLRWKFCFFFYLHFFGFLFSLFVRSFFRSFGRFQLSKSVKWNIIILFSTIFAMKWDERLPENLPIKFCRYLKW